MPNPKGHPASLGIEPLNPGETSKPVRVRGPAWLFDRLSELTPAQIGDLISTALQPDAQPRNDVSQPRNALRGSGPKSALKGKPAQLLELLKCPGVVMVRDGNRYAAQLDGQTLDTFAGATGAALLTRPGLLTLTAPDTWVLTPQDEKPAPSRR